MIQSLSRGIEILNFLKKRDAASITEISLELGISKSTASRLVGTLREYDLVQVSPVSKKYCLGYRILNLSEGVMRRINVITVARPHLVSLMKELNESVHLSSFNNGMVYVIDQILGYKQYTLSATVGMIEPIHCSSVGKSILAYRSASFIRKLLDRNGLVSYTRNTITDPEALLKHLEMVRKQGYAVDNEEITMGVKCVATPIFLPANRIRHSIGVSGLTADMTEHNMKSIVSKLQSACSAISAELMNC